MEIAYIQLALMMPQNGTQPQQVEYLTPLPPHTTLFFLRPSSFTVFVLGARKRKGPWWAKVLCPMNASGYNFLELTPPPSSRRPSPAGGEPRLGWMDGSATHSFIVRPN